MTTNLTLMEQLYPLFKALHILGFVAWFAGLFYLGRMFVYHREALDRKEPEKSILKNQLHIMESRVYRIICHPAMGITWIFGFLMLFTLGWEWFRTNSWIHVKLLLIVLLSIFQVYSKRIIAKLDKEESIMSSQKFRLLNETPTIFLFSIVILAVFQNNLNYGLAISGLLLFGLLIFIFTRIYKSLRERNQNI